MHITIEIHYLPGMKNELEVAFIQVINSQINVQLLPPRFTQMYKNLEFVILRVKSSTKIDLQEIQNTEVSFTWCLLRNNIS